MMTATQAQRTKFCCVLAISGFLSGAAYAEPAGTTEDPFAGRVVHNDLDVEMLLVEAGSFVMGSPDGEPGRASREGPQHTVNFANSFALSRTEISVGQFRQFVEATGYVTDAEKAGSSEIFNARDGRMRKKDGVNWRHDFRGNEAEDALPAIRISWNDAQMFIKWMSESFSREYRLPSEAEFEYALRAGTVTRYWWGDASPDRSVENIPGDQERLATQRWPVAFRGYTDRHWGPSPVASFEPNPFGFFDMGGNAAEWVADCYVEVLTDIPSDGRPSVADDCQLHVFRGASWANPPPLARSAYRNASGPDHASTLLGFRVALDVAQATAQRGQ